MINKAFLMDDEFCNLMFEYSDKVGGAIGSFAPANASKNYLSDLLKNAISSGQRITPESFGQKRDPNCMYGC